VAISELVRDGQARRAAVPIEIMLIDDEDLVRQGFQQALGEAADIAVVAETRVGPEALDLARRRRPGVILIDAGLSRQDGTEIVRELARSPAGHFPGVIALTSLELDDYLFHMLKAGARGFLLKSVSQSELVYAVRAVARGHAFVCPAMMRRLIDRFEILPPPGAGSYANALAALSRREKQVLAGVAVGKSNQEIACELHLTAATVKSHVSHILAKLGLPNRMHAALLAHRVGLVSPPW
jgi:DNA-binding NarL/FixJ family response regulator